MNTLKEALQSMKAPTLTEEQQMALREGARKGRIQGVLMTAAAGSGHPAGSLSSMELYLLAYGAARIDPQNSGPGLSCNLASGDQAHAAASERNAAGMSRGLAATRKRAWVSSTSCSFSKAQVT